MIARRTFVQGSLAAVALATGNSLPASAASPGHAIARYFKVLFDPRQADSLRFAAAIRELGAIPQATGANVTDLWAQELLPRWRKSPAAIAGMTLYPAFFALQMMARDVGMRVAYRADHHFRDGYVEHHLDASRTLLARGQMLIQARDLWAARVAELVMGAEPFASRSRPRRLATHHTQTTGNGEALVSFVIAPVNRHRFGAT